MGCLGRSNKTYEINLNNSEQERQRYRSSLASLWMFLGYQILILVGGAVLYAYSDLKPIKQILYIIVWPQKYHKILHHYRPLVYSSLSVILANLALIPVTVLNLVGLYRNIRYLMLPWLIIWFGFIAGFTGIAVYSAKYLIERGIWIAAALLSQVAFIILPTWFLGVQAYVDMGIQETRSDLHSAQSRFSSRSIDLYPGSQSDIFIRSSSPPLSEAMTSPPDAHLQEAAASELQSSTPAAFLTMVRAHRPNAGQHVNPSLPDLRAGNIQLVGRNVPPHPCYTCSVLSGLSASGKSTVV